MKLTAKCDIEAPLAFVYRSITDFESWERDATARGVEVDRPTGFPIHGPGAAWIIRFTFRGKSRKVQVKIADQIEDHQLSLDLDSQVMSGGSVIDVQPLSPRKTRIKIAVTLKPKTLTARLFINTLRLTKGRVDRRFGKRAEQLGALIENRYMRSQLALLKS